MSAKRSSAISSKYPSLLIGAMLLACPAEAQVFTAVPYTLTNGTLADAAQVMANFNQIINQGNANAATAGINSNITRLSGMLVGSLSTPSYSFLGFGTRGFYFDTVNSHTTSTLDFEIRNDSTDAVLYFFSGTNFAAIDMNTSGQLSINSGGTNQNLDLTATGNVLITSNGTSAGTQISQAGNQPIVFQTNGSTRLTLYGNGHLRGSAGATTLSSCGTSTLNAGSNDMVGWINYGGSPTSCTVNFNQAYSISPACFTSIAVNSSLVTNLSAVGTSSFTIQANGGNLTGVEMYFCIAFNGS